MKGSHILDFFKSPFRQQFLFVCLLLLPALLLCPLFVSFFGLLHTHIDFIQSADEKAVIELVKNWIISQSATTYILAIIGFFLALFLLQGYLLIFANTSLSQKVGLYTFKPVSLSVKQVFKGLIKTISFSFWIFSCFVLSSSLIVLFVALTGVLSELLPTFLSVILWIICVVGCLVVFLWFILNYFVANLRFYMTLKTRSIFEWRENYLFVKKYKSRFFIVLLLCSVFGQAVSVVMQTLFSWIYNVVLFIEGFCAGLKIDQTFVPSFLLILCGIAIFTYLSLLQMSFICKTLVWLKQKPKTKKK